MNQKCILIVDEDKDFRDLIVEYLEDEGFCTQVAENGEIAFNYIMDNKPDLILLDIQLPKLNGLDVCHTLKALPSTSDIPVVFVTASNSLSNMLSGYLAGAMRFLSKPVALGELGDCIRNILPCMTQVGDRLNASSNARA